MTAYIVAGLVLGGVYGISALGLSLTYASSRVFNLGQGAIAYFIAMCFYEMNTEQGWSTPVAAAVALLVIAPAVGFFLWAVLFRWLAHSDPTVKLVATIGLYVAIPPITQFVFTDEQIFKAPGIAGLRPTVHDVLGVRINEDQLAVFAAALLVALLLWLLLRFTTFGLLIRAVVDSESMSELAGTNAALVSAGTWVIGAMLAGLAGVLVAPIVSLEPTSYALLVIGSFAAAVVGRLSNLPLTFAGALLVGVIGGLGVKYLPDTGVFARGFRPSVPFIVMMIFLLAYSSSFGREPRSRDPQATAYLARAAEVASPRIRAVGLLVLAAMTLLLPQMLDSFWVTIVTTGIAFGIIFLSITVVTGDGGMISLCQITFAGVGAISTAQLATEHGWPLGLAILAGGLIAVPFGILVALPALRLGDIYLALATLGFGLLMDNLVFASERFDRIGLGVDIARPSFFGIDFTNDENLYYLLVVVFAVLALVVANLRASTTGKAMAAVRASERASATVGVSVVQSKLVIFALSAFIAGVGGGLLATLRYNALPTDYGALIGIVWLAVVVTWGVRSSAGALIAGIVFAGSSQVINDLFGADAVLLTPALFGLAAILLAREPRGMLASHGHMLRRLASTSGRTRGAVETGSTVP